MTTVEVSLDVETSGTRKGIMKGSVTGEVPAIFKMV